MTTERSTYYFDGEGRPAMEDCIRHAAEWCVQDGVMKMVIFTGTGIGPHWAAKELLVEDHLKHLQVVAVTPPFGRPYRSDLTNPNSPLIQSGINLALRDELDALGIKTVSAHLPFKEMHDGKSRTSEWSRVAEAFGVLGGGFALCIQAVLVACDAGLVAHGERVVAVSADTALAVTACRTESFLSPLEGLLVGHIICRPGRYNISKSIHEAIRQPEAPRQIGPVETTGSESSPWPPPQLKAGRPEPKKGGAARAMSASRGRKPRKS